MDRDALERRCVDVRKSRTVGVQNELFVPKPLAISGRARRATPSGARTGPQPLTLTFYGSCRGIGKILAAYCRKVGALAALAAESWPRMAPSGLSEV